MSDSQETPAEQIDPNDPFGTVPALQKLANDVYRPVFLQRLQQNGLYPQTEAEVDEYIKLGQDLSEIASVPAIKAAAEDSPLSRASASLQTVKNQLGLSKQAEESQLKQQLLAYAKQAAAVPELTEAVLRLRAHDEMIAELQRTNA